MVMLKFLDKMDRTPDGGNGLPDPVPPEPLPPETTIPVETTVPTEVPETTVPDMSKGGEGFSIPSSIELFGQDVPVWLIALIVVLVIIAVVTVVVLIRRKKRRLPVTKVDMNPIIEQMTPPPAAPAAVSAGPGVFAAVHQHIGAREDQQDSYGVSDPNLYPQAGLMAVVADGMGGLANGRAVSSALVRTFQEGYRYANPGTDPADMLLDLAVRANSGVNQMLRGAERSGSTLVAASIRGGMLHFLTVGDSRIYLYRGGALLQLNREHIYQEELAVKALNQVVSLQQVKGDRQAHSLTSYFGIGRIPAMDRNYEGIKLIDGDKLLLASDGVFGTLSQAQMEAALSQSVQEAARTLGDWVRAANRPHQDNNTAVILEYRA